ncbi:hypothetical protein CFK37_12225 [Virgibacillus phasianinus]|uniref:Lipoprotein n=1 Tax=Virgibacillus phasianinus TaxID=2017483 RepID=A0A220U434_9BACI|nr:hypothetical protein [Virgibacillus phasianinus]ASK62860.1 hypothetical protein CFK37_12225 [Virgibacillus phasianinus]
MKKVLMILLIGLLIAGCSNDPDESKEKKDKEDSTTTTTKNENAESNSDNESEQEEKKKVELNKELEHEKYDELAKKYFNAWLVSDYDTMKSFLSDKSYKVHMEIISIDVMGLKGAGPGEIGNPEYKDMVGEKFEILASDFYFKDHGLVLYLVEFNNPLTEKNKDDVKYTMFGVKKENGKLTEVGAGGVLEREFFREENFGGKLMSFGSVETIIKKYPKHGYMVHEYSTE